MLDCPFYICSLCFKVCEISTLNKQKSDFDKQDVEQQFRLHVPCRRGSGGRKLGEESGMATLKQVNFTKPNWDQVRSLFEAEAKTVSDFQFSSDLPHTSGACLSSLRLI